jgi:DNA repair exonuclease SbcCD nuclease subunit
MINKEIPNMQVLFAADLHLRTHTYRRRPEINGDARYALGQIKWLQDAYNCPLVLAGDTFHGNRPDLETLLYVKDEMSGTYNESTPTFFIKGNHDKTTPHPLELFDAIPLGLVTLDKYNLYGIDYQVDQSALQEQLDNIPPMPQTKKKKPLILVIHQTSGHWEDFNYPGEIELTHGMIPPVVDYVILGHFHKTLDCPILRSDGKLVPCISVGSPYLVSIPEDPKKYIYGIDDKGTLHKIPIQSRRVIQREIETDADLQEILAGIEPDKTNNIPPEIKTPILRILCLDDYREKVEKFFKTELGDKVHLFVMPLRKTNKIKDTTIEDAAFYDVSIDSNVAQVLAEFRQNEPNPKVQKLTEAIISCDLSPETYKNLKSEFIKC